MLVPEILWSVSEKLYGQNVAASEDQEARCGGAEIDNRPKSALHRFLPPFSVLILWRGKTMRRGMEIRKKVDGDVSFLGWMGTATL
jgi:hypothetical protein